MICYLRFGDPVPEEINKTDAETDAYSSIVQIRPILSLIPSLAEFASCMETDSIR